MSYYTTYRPDCLEELAGNEDIKEKFEEYINDPEGMLPHAIMLTGESGTGKTTLSRILALGIDAQLQEYNCASIRGLDDFREIVSTMAVKPLRSSYRIILLDEVHQLPNATQDLLLKPLEDGTSSTIIILCTTNPEKLKKTIHTRCVTYRCESLDPTSMRSVIKRVAKLESIKLKVKAVDAMIQAANGSARQALTILESISGLSNELMLKKIASYNGEYSEEVVMLCRAIINNCSFAKALALSKKIEGEPETIRRTVLGYACACMSNPKMCDNAYYIADAFRENWFDTGKQGLPLALYEACNHD